MQRTPNLDLAFRALAHGTRRSLIHALARGQVLSARELARRLAGESRAISRHLGVLQRAGLIEDVSEGRVTRFRLVREVLQSAAGWLARQDTLHVLYLDLLDKRLSEAARSDRRTDPLHEPPDL